MPQVSDLGRGILNSAGLQRDSVPKTWDLCDAERERLPVRQEIVVKDGAGDPSYVSPN